MWRQASASSPGSRSATSRSRRARTSRGSTPRTRSPATARSPRSPRSGSRSSRIRPESRSRSGAELRPADRARSTSSSTSGRLGARRTLEADRVGIFSAVIHEGTGPVRAGCCREGRLAALLAREPARPGLPAVRSGAPASRDRAVGAAVSQYVETVPTAGGSASSDGTELDAVMGERCLVASSRTSARHRGRGRG